ncbi:39S ribosomal protein L39, mitochondrial isoform X2 [Hemicordylus capensis]|uniref:39S ribosomal protein L39, mitochondrial isoform X2 n=1 Tax=Hemicordylus capensis TaxID=884348 RepID=UPI0023025248|nr:39S ribosomal protein L39, mitochondrial isoform X2 [Hemicordylus capensis]
MASRRLARRLWSGCSRRFVSTAPAPQLSTAEIAQMRSELFTKEKERQLSLYPRIEKIEVKYVGKSHPGTLFIMNKGLSTPYSCAMHLSEWHSKKSVLALVNGEVWDMYRPFTQTCEIQFLTFKDEDPEEVNKAYWRSCAMILGYVLEQAFKDEYSVTLVRAPEVPVISGAFCYDVLLDNRLDEWKPTEESFRSLTKEVHKLIHKDLPFEMLDVDAKVALEIFQHNKYKLDRVEQKASQNADGIVRLYRFGDFVDVSEGPHIPRTSMCCQYEVTSVHNLEGSQSELIRRFQGLSVPIHLRLHHSVWYRLRERSQKLVNEDRWKEAKDENEVSNTESV